MALIIGAKRTAVVPRNGAFGALFPHDLAAPVVQKLMQDAGLEPGRLDQIFLANALGGGGNPARMTALAAGLDHISGISIDAQCAGGLDAMALAIAHVDAGFADVVIAGGSESFSQRPLRAWNRADGTTDFYSRPPFSPFPDRDPEMVKAADDVATLLGIDREEQDAFAISSHHKAMVAREWLQEEIVPISGVVNDAFPRRLSPALARRTKALSGSISVASTAPEADGAAFCLIVSDRIGIDTDFAARIVAQHSAGADPTKPPLAPVPAIKRVLAQAGIRPDDLSLIEMMEAFSVQAIACNRLCDLPFEKTNLSGGALARGHPIGASGAILLCRVFHELRRHPGKALCAIAAAGGIGSALILEG
nr:thiolase family protein [uncultured Cohaesibacter sp.]